MSWTDFLDSANFPQDCSRLFQTYFIIYFINYSVLKYGGIKNSRNDLIGFLHCQGHENKVTRFNELYVFAYKQVENDTWFHFFESLCVLFTYFKHCSIALSTKRLDGKSWLGGGALGTHLNSVIYCITLARFYLNLKFYCPIKLMKKEIYTNIKKIINNNFHHLNIYVLNKDIQPLSHSNVSTFLKQIFCCIVCWKPIFQKKNFFGKRIHNFQCHPIFNIFVSV